MPITFTIKNQGAVLHQVSITTLKSELAQIVSIVGSYCNIESTSFRGAVLGNRDRLKSITIDGQKDIQGDQREIRAIFEKVQRAITQRTGNATLAGKNLVITTGQ